MLTYRLRVLAGRRGALLTHPSDSVNLDTFDDDGTGQGRRAVQDIHYLLYTNEWGIPFGEQGCGLSMKTSTTTNFWFLGNRRLASVR